MIVDRSGLARIERADQIDTKTQAARTFLLQPSGRALLAAAVALVAWRPLAGSFGLADLAMIALTITLVGPFEWLVHRFLLHAPAESARMTKLGTGTGHVEHHRDPAELRWLMLCWRDVAIFTLALGAIAAAIALPVAVFFDASKPATFATAWAAASVGLLHYEWTHLLVHTRYRCRTRHYRELQRHHRLHHYRNEHYWLGVTTRSGDRLLHTMPDRSDVERSATARTLGQA